jgi:DNA polymerase epsilon subunit 2
VKTVIDQAHLCPLPLSVRPVYWSFDNALRLFPLPDLLILADEYDGYMQGYADCTAVNPGALSPLASPVCGLCRRRVAHRADGGSVGIS